jgi:hypothetical protein
MRSSMLRPIIEMFIAGALALALALLLMSRM